MVFAGIVLAVAALACVTGPRERPPTEEEIAFEKARANLDTVALMPLRSAMPHVEREQVVAAFEDRLVRRLEAAGLRVLRPSVWDELWRRYAADVGQIFDPKTGKVDEERRRTVYEAVVRELGEAHAVDAILFAAVTEDTHYGVYSIADACGGREAPYWPSGWRPRPEHPASRVEIACLNVVLDDMNGKTLFGRRAPVEGIETYHLQTLAVRPRLETFRDSANLDLLVESMFDLLPVKPKADPGASPAEESGAPGDSPTAEARTTER